MPTFSGMDFGKAVQRLPDMDSNGYAEIAVGAYYGNAVFVLYMQNGPTYVQSSVWLNSTTNKFGWGLGFMNGRLAVGSSAVHQIAFWSWPCMTGV